MIMKKDWEKIIDGTKTAYEIAEENNVSVGEVYYMSKKYSLPLKNGRKTLANMLDYHGISVEQLKADIAVMPISSVAKKYSLDANALRNWCIVRGIKYTKNKDKITVNTDFVPKRRTGEMMDMIKYLLPKFTDASIARVFGYSKEGIRLIRKQMEVEK